MEKNTELMSLRELTDALTARDVLLKEKTEEARVSLELFRSIFNMLPNPIVVTSAYTGLIEHVNKAFQDVTGYVECEVIGKSSLILYKDPKDRETIIEMVQKEGQAKDIPVVFLHKNGSPIECIMLVKPITRDKLSVYLSLVERIGHRRASDKEKEV